MTKVTELIPPPSKALDLAKKADMEEYIVIGTRDGTVKLWHSRMSNQDCYTVLQIVATDLMDDMRGIGHDD